MGAIYAATTALWAMVPAITISTWRTQSHYSTAGGLSIGVAGMIGAWVKWSKTIKEFVSNIWGKMMDKIGEGLKKLSHLVWIFSEDQADAMALAGQSLQETAADVSKLDDAFEELDDTTEYLIAEAETLPPVLENTANKVKELDLNTKKLNVQWKWAIGLLDGLKKAQAEAAKKAEALNDRLKNQRLRLLNLPTDKAIQAFEELTRTWEGLNEVERAVATDRYRDSLRAAAKAGHKLTDEQIALANQLDVTDVSGAKLEVTLAALAGKLGGAAGQSLNLARAMIQTNRTLKKGEKGFSQIRIGAAIAGAAFHGLGEAVGGAAGKIVGHIADLADAFAQGGVLGLVMAGIGKIAKGIAGLFSRGRRKREAAAKREAARLAELTRVAEEAARVQEEYWDNVYGAAINAYDRAASAGVSAYDKIFVAALESGAGQEEAVAKATAAQLAASEKILADEGEKFARIAAFEAALEARRSGNAEGAAQAARIAARDTRIAWKEAMAAVAEADKITTDTMKLSSTELQITFIADQQRVADKARKLQAEAWHRNLMSRMAGGYMGGGFTGGVPPPDGFRQHGGPVMAGRRYRVGERGPEDFIPSQPGRIAPNSTGGGSGASFTAKDIAKAVAEAMQGVTWEVDGRKIGRAFVRHQPLAAAELGGRR